jgi:hypothetical protein
MTPTAPANQPQPNDGNVVQIDGWRKVKPASERTAQTARASRTASSGSRPGTRSASTVLPTPDGS